MNALPLFVGKFCCFFFFLSNDRDIVFGVVKIVDVVDRRARHRAVPQICVSILTQAIVLILGFQLSASRSTSAEYVIK